MSDYMKLPIEIIRCKDLASISKLIYARIKEFQPEGCYMGISDYKEELGLTRPTVTGALKELKAKGYIEELPYHGLKIIKEIKAEAPAEENQSKQKKAKAK